MEQKKTLCLSSNNIYSHPNKLLEEHLSSVGRFSQEILSSKILNLNVFIRESVLSDISYLIGVTHDSAKATSYFQDYIREENEERKQRLKNKSETHHACLSAIFTYYTIKKYLSDKGLLDVGHYKYLPILSFLAVKRHHGNLDNIADEIINFDEKVLERQIKTIDFDSLNKILKKLISRIGIEFDCLFIKEKILTQKPVYIYGKIRGYKKSIKKTLKRRKD